MTLSDQLTAALRLECAVADGTLSYSAALGPAAWICTWTVFLTP